ncbi:hypothetical protein HQ590_06565 [bacterium]|nr:hypothetical protein [bacterium]
MNRSIVIVLAAVVAVGVMTGCGKKSDVDTGQLEQSFQAAEPQAQSLVDQAVAAVQRGDYAGAMSSLQKLANQAKLTPEQQAAIKDLMARVQKAMSAAAAQAQEDAGKAVDDVKKSLPLR